jgi:hypothetical protein
LHILPELLQKGVFGDRKLCEIWRRRFLGQPESLNLFSAHYYDEGKSQSLSISKPQKSR